MLEREAAAGIHRIEDVHTNGPQIVSGAATVDSARALRSLEALAATGANTVLCGHGPVWRDGAESIVEGARRRGPSQP